MSIKLLADITPNFIGIENLTSAQKNVLLIVSFIVFVSGIWDYYIEKKEKREKEYKELKVKVQNAINKFSSDFTFGFSITIASSYIKTKVIYNHFKNEKHIIKCLAELNSIIYKTEYEIRELIRKNVPDLCILNSNDEILAIIRFTKLNNGNNLNGEQFVDDTPYLYDTNGNFLGILREYKYVIDAKGIYKGELIMVLGSFYAVPYTSGWTARFEPLPNIIFTKNEVENFKNFLPTEMILQQLPECKPKIVLDTI